jgi:hypothetical protein
MNTQTYSVLSIDAWAGDEPHSWDWNAWYSAGKVSVNLDAEPHEILAAMADAGFIRNPELGDVEDDQYNLVIVDKDSREPIFAIVYGDHHEETPIPNPYTERGLEDRTKPIRELPTFTGWTDAQIAAYFESN